MELRRTMLFMPGNNPGMLQTAAVFGSDAVIFDLEDAVALTEKDAARYLISEALRTNKYDDVEVVEVATGKVMDTQKHVLRT